MVQYAASSDQVMHLPYMLQVFTTQTTGRAGQQVAAGRQCLPYLENFSGDDVEFGGLEGACDKRLDHVHRIQVQILARFLRFDDLRATPQKSRLVGNMLLVCCLLRDIQLYD